MPEMPKQNGQGKAKSDTKSSKEKEKEGESMTISFTVPGKPVPMARPRVTSHGTYTPAKCKEYKTVVGILAAHAMRKAQAELFEDEPLECYVRFVFPLPKSRKNPWATSKPDLDNLYKSVTDGMIGIVYKDDAQIVRATIEKTYTVNGEGGAEISVQTI